MKEWTSYVHAQLLHPSSKPLVRILFFKKPWSLEAFKVWYLAFLSFLFSLIRDWWGWSEMGMSNSLHHLSPFYSVFKGNKRSTAIALVCKNRREVEVCCHPCPANCYCKCWEGYAWRMLWHAVRPHPSKSSGSACIWGVLWQCQHCKVSVVNQLKAWPLRISRILP